MEVKIKAAYIYMLSKNKNQLEEANNGKLAKEIYKKYGPGGFLVAGKFLGKWITKS